MQLAVLTDGFHMEVGPCVALEVRCSVCENFFFFF